MTSEIHTGYTSDGELKRLSTLEEYERAQRILEKIGLERMNEKDVVFSPAQYLLLLNAYINKRAVCNAMLSFQVSSGCPPVAYCRVQDKYTMMLLQRNVSITNKINVPKEKQKSIVAPILSGCIIATSIITAAFIISRSNKK